MLNTVVTSTDYRAAVMAVDGEVGSIQIGRFVGGKTFHRPTIRKASEGQQEVNAPLGFRSSLSRRGRADLHLVLDQPVSHILHQPPNFRFAWAPTVPLIFPSRASSRSIGRANVGIASFVDLAVDSVRCSPALPHAESTSGRRDLHSARALAAQYSEQL